ncbi:MAG: hypothetical protein JSR87_02185 [Proteobacteria bacterium]|nr:hypothetical protein [Pseudomonadota bacterium]MBS0573477.1 hypothetical protein [Pseudomonadota bacterium]
MNRSAGSAARNQGRSEKYPSVDALLREGSFYERLEKARALRAEALARAEPDSSFVAEDALGALAAKAGEGEIPEGEIPVAASASPLPDAPALPDPSPAASRKPENLFVLNPSRPFAADDGDTLPVAKLYAAAVAVPSEPLPVTASPAPDGRRFKVAGGFAVGLAFGLAVAALVPGLALWRQAGTPAPAAAGSGPAFGPVALPQSADDRPPLVPAGAPDAVPAVGVAAAPSATAAEDSAPAIGAQTAGPPGLILPRLALAAAPALPATELAPLVPAARPDRRPVAEPRAARLTVDPAADPELAARTSPPDPSAPPQTASHIRLMVPAGATKAEIAALRDKLGKSGIGIAETAPLSTRLRKSQVRYYYPDDLAAADRLAKAMGATLRDATALAKRPPPGTIDIRYAAQAKPKKTARASRSAGQELTALRAHILKLLRGAGN